MKNIFLVLTLIFTSNPIFAAAMRCENIFTKNKPIPKVMPEESSVEIEIGASDSVIELFDTLDGTIGPVVKGTIIKDLPPHLLESLMDYTGGDATQIKTAPWDALSPSEKRDLIMSSAKIRQQQFSNSRVVQGLKYREKISLHFNENTRFLGNDYKPGTYQFNSSKIFPGTAIEFMGPNRMTQNLGFELHARGFLNGGENFLTARALQKSLVGTYQNVHTHIVAPYPKVNIEVESFRATEFTRRATLIFDVVMIERGIPMTKIQTQGMENSLNFLPAESTTYLKLYRSFKSRPYSGEHDAVYSKGGTVGVRSFHYYDKKVWGLEFRYLPGRLDKNESATRISILQDKLLFQDYFMSEDQTLQFLNSRGIADEATLIQDLNYADASQFWKNLNRIGFSVTQKVQIIKEAEKNDFIKMLFHDWSKDPMFYSNKTRIEQIQMTQKISINMLLSNTPSTEVMRYFVKKSGIAYELHQSME